MPLIIELLQIVIVACVESGENRCLSALKIHAEAQIIIHDSVRPYSVQLMLYGKGVGRLVARPVRHIEMNGSVEEHSVCVILGGCIQVIVLRVNAHMQIILYTVGYLGHCLVSGLAHGRYGNSAVDEFSRICYRVVVHIIGKVDRVIRCLNDKLCRHIIDHGIVRRGILAGILLKHHREGEILSSDVLVRRQINSIGGSCGGADKRLVPIKENLLIGGFDVARHIGRDFISRQITHISCVFKGSNQNTAHTLHSFSDRKVLKRDAVA